MRTRCKFRINEIGETDSTRYIDGKPVPSTLKKLRASPVYSNEAGHENKKFWDATPSGSFEISCVNSEAVADLKPGDEIYLDISKA